MDSNVSDNNSATQFVDKLLRENHLRGAIDFAKRVQNSFRELKRLWHFLANIVVHVSSEEEEVEVDWYTVLGVDSSADLQTMKKQYVQLAKGSSLGSIEAHKLLNKAWNILSGRFTRISYDGRRNSRELQQNALAANQESSANEIFSQGFSNVNNTIVNNQKSSDNDCSIRGSDQKDDFANQRESSAIDWESSGNPDTFLTACPSCHSESLQVCLISKLGVCLQCGKAFAILEVPAPDYKHKEGMGFVQDMDNEHNAADDIENAATEDREDALKTMEVLPNSEFQGFDQNRTQESSVDDQVQKIFSEMSEYFGPLPPLL